MAEFTEIEELIAVYINSNGGVLMLREEDLAKEDPYCLVLQVHKRHLQVSKLHTQLDLKNFYPLTRDEVFDHTYRNQLTSEFPLHLLLRRLVELKELVDKEG